MMFKGRLTRDFRLQVFFISPWPLPLWPFRVLSKIRGDIRESMFVTGVIDTGDKLFTGVNDISEKSLSQIFSDRWCC
jgi:hypothetical protein